MKSNFYPPFTFEWRGAADGGIWYVGWPGLTSGEFRGVSFPKRRNARRLYRRWLNEQTYGRAECCPQCEGQGYVRVLPGDAK